MVTTPSTAPDWSTFPDSDGEPVAENRTNLVQMTDLIYAAEHYLAPRVGYAVGGNQFIYYDRRDGRRHVAPDVYVALGVAPGRREKWETWREGDKFPDIVVEITSPSTQEEIRLHSRQPAAPARPHVYRGAAGGAPGIVARAAPLRDGRRYGRGRACRGTAQRDRALLWHDALPNRQADRR